MVGVKPRAAVSAEIRPLLPSGFPACQARTDQMHREILDGKSFVADMRHASSVEFLVLQVDDLMAYLADQVMVTVNLPVETRRRTGVVKSADNSHIRQRIENAIDRCPRNSRNTVLHHLQDLIRRRVIVSLKNCLEHDTTLHCKGHALASAQPLELPQSLSGLIGLHVHKA